MGTHSSILAWEIPWAEEPDGLQFMGSSDMTEATEHARLLPYYFLPLSSSQLLFFPLLPITTWPFLIRTTAPASDLVSADPSSPL